MRGAGGARKGELWLSGYRLPVLQNERDLEIGCPAIEICLTLLNCTPKKVKRLNFVMCISP